MLPFFVYRFSAGVDVYAGGIVVDAICIVVDASGDEGLIIIKNGLQGMNMVEERGVCFRQSGVSLFLMIKGKPRQNIPPDCFDAASNRMPALPRSAVVHSLIGAAVHGERAAPWFPAP